MKTGIRTLLACLLLACACGSAQANPQLRVKDTVSGCLNVREDPNTSADVRTCIQPGTIVTALDSGPYWRKIQVFPGVDGWAAKRYLEPTTSPAPSPESDTIPANAWLEFHFIDVGQGDAIWITTHDDGLDGNGRFEGKNIVIDGGPYSADATNPLLAYLEERSHHDAIIDTLIITHPHTDHYLGAVGLARHFEIGDFYGSGYPGSETYVDFLEQMRGSTHRPAKAQRVHIGRQNFGTFDWGNELCVEVLYAYDPALQDMGSGNTENNNASIVLRIEYGEHSFLLMGDAEGKDRSDAPNTARYVEKVLLDTQPPAKLAATVLKVGHHGSETSSTIPFIQAVNPEVVIVQSGRKSFNGTFIPDRTTLQRYCDHNSNIRIYRTDQHDEADGLRNREAVDSDHIVVRTNGAQMQVQALEGGQPFTVSSCSNEG